MNSSSEAPVASSTLATDSVDGQRSRPSTDTRFDLLKVVASNPAFFGQSGSSQAVVCGDRINRRPDLTMHQHRSPRAQAMPLTPRPLLWLGMDQSVGHEHHDRQDGSPASRRLSGPAAFMVFVIH